MDFQQCRNWIESIYRWGLCEYYARIQDNLVPNDIIWREVTEEMEDMKSLLIQNDLPLLWLALNLEI